MTYKIIGADGREYGPVAADQVRQWFAENRMNAQIKVQAAGRAEWCPLAELPEFAALVDASALPPFIAPPVVAAAGEIGPATNPLAITGLICGIVGITIGWVLCWPLVNVVGIVFSAIGLSQINRSAGRQPGKGMAVTGLVLSVLGVIIPLVIFFAIFFVGFHRHGIHPRWHF